MLAYRNDLSIYIDQTEVFYIAFPRFNGSHCSYYSIDLGQRLMLDLALERAKEIVTRFIADGRTDATSEELKKAFARV